MNKRSISIGIIVIALTCALLLWQWAPAKRVEVEHAATPLVETSQAAVSEVDVKLNTARSDARIDEDPLIGSKLRVKGTIRFLNASGEHVPSAQGWIKWLLQPSSGPSEEYSAITHDEWRLEAERGTQVRLLSSLWADNVTTQYADAPDMELTIDQLQGAEIVAILRAGPILNVVDFSSRNHLKDVQLILANSSHGEYQDLRVPARKILQSTSETLDSPIALADRPGTRSAWVRAPGYAWARFAYRGEGGEVTVALSPGGTLEIQAPGRLETASVLYALGFPRTSNGGLASTPLFERQLSLEGLARIEGVPTGTIQVVLTTSPAVREPGPFVGIRVVDIQPGHTHEVSFDTAGEGTGLCELNVVVPSSLGVGLSSMSRLVVEPLDLERDRPLEFYLANRWSDRSVPFNAKFSNILPGNYAVTLLPLGISAKILMAANAVESLTLAEATSIATVTVVVSRVGMMEQLSSADVRFRPSSVKSFRAWTDVAPDLDKGSYTFRCVPGSVSVMCSFSGHKLTIVHLSVQPGQNDAVIELEKEVRNTITVRALQGDTEIPLPSAFWRETRIESLESPPGKHFETKIGMKQVANLTASDAPWASYVVDRTGRYQVVFPNWPGLVDVAELLVDVPATGSVEGVITVDFN